MTDLDRLLEESLKSARDRYRTELTEDRVEAKTRFLRRYRRRRFVLYSSTVVAAAGLSVLLAFLVVDPSGGSRDQVERPEDPAGKPSVGVSIPLPSTPDEVVISASSAWVSSSEARVVYRIDLATNEVVDEIQTGGTPGDIEAGATTVWIANPELGEIQRYDIASGTLIEPIPIEASDSLEVAIRDESLWAVADRSDLVRLEVGTDELVPVVTTSPPIDVAIDQAGRVWVLQTGGNVVQFDPATGEPLPPSAAAASGADDISSGNDAVWLGGTGSGSLIRIDHDSRKVRTIDLDGEYVDLALSDKGTWVLTSDGQGAGLLLPLWLQDQGHTGEPVPVEGEPVEVAAGGGYLWVATTNADAVLKIAAPEPPAGL